jgi:hypothetical protein
MMPTPPRPGPRGPDPIPAPLDIPPTPDEPPAVLDEATLSAATVDASSAHDVTVTIEAQPTTEPEPPPMVTQGTPVRVTPDPVKGAPFVPGKTPTSAQLGLPSSREEVADFVARAAASRGIEPTVAVRVVMSEGGLSPATWIGDNGSSFGPLQLHYGGIAGGGNAVSGLGELFTRDTGRSARDLSLWRTQIVWSMDYAARNGWSAWHGADRVGIGARDGLQGARAQAHGGAQLLNVVARQHVAVPNQFDAGLSDQDSFAACGAVAAVAVARWLGRNPSVPEVLQIAQRVGWTRDGGMNGIANEKRLLDNMGISARMDTPPNWRNIRADALAGHPVILSTPKHYFVIDDYNPRTGTYHVGQSGLAFSGGSEWMTGAQIQMLGGGASGALHVTHPLSPKPSVAMSQPQPPAAALVTVSAHIAPSPDAPTAAATAPEAVPSDAPAATTNAAPQDTEDRWWENLPTHPTVEHLDQIRRQQAPLPSVTSA